jgi:hypothetical protein
VEDGVRDAGERLTHSGHGRESFRMTKLQLNVDEIGSKLDRCRILDSDLKLFGANTHRYQLGLRLAETTVREYEERHSLQLPADYRTFLLQVGNGGAGPCYGLYPLGFFADYQVGDLSKPFPHTAAWNVPEDWFNNLPDPWGEKGKELPHSWPSVEVMLDAVASLPVDRAAAAKRQELESWYFGSEHVNGAIPICHEGCGYYDLLVVRGPAYGSIWIDGRASDGGIAPLTTAHGQRHSFGSWYMAWLDETIQDLR